MATSNGTGAVGGNAQNVPEAHVPRTRSTFPLKAHRFNTERYGEYTPIFAMESVKEDKLPVRLSHNLLSYTMKKPLMQTISKVKDLFSVPMEALFPLNWEKFYDNPVRGDDVNVDVGPTIVDFWSKVGTLMDDCLTQLKLVLADTSVSHQDALTSVFRYLVLGEMFYSNGSLLSSLNCHGAPYFEVTDSNGFNWDYDLFFDDAISTLLADVQSIHIISDNAQYNYDYNAEPYSRNSHYIPFNHILCLFRDDPTTYVTSTDFDATMRSNFLTFLNSFTLYPIKAATPLNNQFLLAYQVCCAHFYTNDHVDYIYSCELYRQLLNHYTTVFNSFAKTFVRNGLNYSYDSTSAHYFNGITGFYITTPANWQYVLKVTTGTTTNDIQARAFLGYLSAIFSYRRSLKYMDYFVGGRTQPLAVGASSPGMPTSTDVAVSGGLVSVIDISRSIQAQRFLNSVNRFAHKFEDYLKGLFGGRLPAPDYHNPFHLARTVDTVFGDETMNTGEAQINTYGGTPEPIAITTNLRGSSSKYMFEIDSDRPCVIIAIGSYDVPRVHKYSMDRSFLHQDRFDYFNPFMQYVGDQSIYTTELGINSAIPLANFSYGLRHGEYKQLYNSCAGGFVEYLPGFVFPAIDRRGTISNLNPEFIRCIQSELDQFYSSLTGHSLASYFHFIVDNEVDCSGSRPMAFAPQILG